MHPVRLFLDSLEEVFADLLATLLDGLPLDLERRGVHAAEHLGVGVDFG